MGCSANAGLWPCGPLVPLSALLRIGLDHTLPDEWPCSAIYAGLLTGAGSSESVVCIRRSSGLPRLPCGRAQAGSGAACASAHLWSFSESALGFRISVALCLFLIIDRAIFNRFSRCNARKIYLRLPICLVGDSAPPQHDHTSDAPPLLTGCAVLCERWRARSWTNLIGLAHVPEFSQSQVLGERVLF